MVWGDTLFVTSVARDNPPALKLGDSGIGMADDKVHLAAEGGEMIVLKAGQTFEVLTRIDMGAPLMATPAISNRTLFIRTPGEVYAVGATPVSKTAAR